MTGQRPGADAESIRLIGAALRQLLRLAPDVHARLAQRLGVGVTDMLALDHLTTEPDSGVGVVALAERLGIRSASATVLVDRLEAADHVHRVPHPTDRRRTTVVLTDQAHHGAQTALAPLIAELTAVTAGLDEPTAVAVLDYLTKVCAVLKGFATADAGPSGDDQQPDPHPPDETSRFSVHG